MMGMKADDEMTELNRVMATLGFYSEGDEDDAYHQPRQLRSLRYLDGQGNRLDLRFSLQVSPERSGLLIEVWLNDDRFRAWYALESLVQEIGAMLTEWMQPREAPPREAVTPSKRRDRKPDLTIPAVLADLRSGMDDESLMEKYRLSHRRLLSVMSKLVWEGLVTQEQLAQRRSLARTVFMPVYQCRLCKEIHFNKVEHCPRCGGPMFAMNKQNTD
jgi:hypothetical protein